LNRKERGQIRITFLVITRCILFYKLKHQLVYAYLLWFYLVVINIILIFLG